MAGSATEYISIQIYSARTNAYPFIGGNLWRTHTHTQQQTHSTGNNGWKKPQSTAFHVQLISLRCFFFWFSVAKVYFLPILIEKIERKEVGKLEEWIFFFSKKRLRQ